MTTQDILSLRLHNQQLLIRQFTKPSEVVKWMGAMQSQDYPGAKWALAQRVPDATDASLEEAFNNGEIVRTHVLRPTWHFVHPEDASWMLELTGSKVKRMMSAYNKSLGLNDEIYERSEKIIRKFLEKKESATRQEIKEELTTHSIHTNVTSLAHIVMFAELNGVIISGPKIGSKFSYMLLERRVPSSKKLGREESISELTRRYFLSHGPATKKDFSWWSGLNMQDVRNGIQMNNLSSETLDGIEYFFFSSTSKPIPLSCFLLPNYDEYGIAYTERSAFLHPSYTKLLATRGNAAFQHLIVVNGQFVGTWKRTLRKNDCHIETEFFMRPSKEKQKAFEKAVEDYSKFLGLSVTTSDKNYS